MSVEQSEETSERGKNRGYLTTIIVQVLTAVVALWGLSQSWVIATSDSGFGQQEVSVSGMTLYPVSAAGAWVALALVAAVVATSGRLRQALGLVACVAGVAVLVGPVSFLFASEVEIATNSARVAATGAERTSAWLIVALAGIALVAVGIVVWIMGASWRRLSSRQSGVKSTVDPWEALDRGDDPTS